MKMLFRQRFLSLLDSYDVYAEDGSVLYRVEGRFAWAHKVDIFDRNHALVGTVRQRIITFLPKFEITLFGQYRGCICREFTLFRPRYYYEANGWQVAGSFLEWDYRITDAAGRTVATISKELFHLTDTYVMDVVNPADAVEVLMFVLAMDAEKCSRNN